MNLLESGIVKADKTFLLYKRPQIMKKFGQFSSRYFYSLLSTTAFFLVMGFMITAFAQAKQAIPEKVVIEEQIDIKTLNPGKFRLNFANWNEIKKVRILRRPDETKPIYLNNFPEEESVPEKEHPPLYLVSGKIMTENAKESPFISRAKIKTPSVTLYSDHEGRFSFYTHNPEAIELSISHRDYITKSGLFPVQRNQTIYLEQKPPLPTYSSRGKYS